MDFICFITGIATGVLATLYVVWTIEDKKKGVR